MDTGTHVVMGIALGGLATLDPVIASDPVLKQTIMIATIVGSQAPDFDTVLKLKNNAAYIRNHRGITHSLPAIFLWPFLITGAILFFVPEVSALHVLLWSFIAVFLHVFVDIFNAYGTQALRPIYNKWIALGVINTFDPFIFTAHIVAIIIWQNNFHPGYVFLALYIILLFYYLWRIQVKHQVVQEARKFVPDATHVFVSPTMRWNKWHVVIRSKEKLIVAQSIDKEMQFFETYPFEPIPNNPIITAARNDKNLAAFLSFSPTYRWEIEKRDTQYEVRFIDLRYRTKGHYPFVAIVQLNKDLDVISSYTGWVFSEKTLRRKLHIATQ